MHPAGIALHHYPRAPAMMPHHRHLRGQLNELRAALAWLRTLTPDGPRYKLWLGDLVEFVHAAFGPASAQMLQVREVLTGTPRLPTDAGEQVQTLDYLARLDRFAAVLVGFERDLPGVITLIDFSPDNGNPHRG